MLYSRTIKGNKLKGKQLLTCFLILLMIFLTSANYFVSLSSSKSSNCAIAGSSDETNDNFPGNNPAGPDEKSPDTPVSFSEEYIHDDAGDSDFFLINRLFKHLIGGSDKIEHVNYELISPPPEC